jgi:RHH-type proline utilization regulon transcriptional repressor/proline dehydrogenase/delta 1-pyrroline-5-carboxylate dehydrogenase
VAPGSPFHLTECFGPVLGLMRAGDLDEAIRWQNQPAYGLTAGLHSLDPGEIAHWRDRVEAGNLYVNRHTTGAVVRRQPFGGWKRSAVGPGAKAGGMHYVASLGRWDAAWSGTVGDYEAAVGRTLRTDLAPSDPSGLAAEGNVARCLPLRRVLLRIGPDTRAADLHLALAAGRAAGTVVTVSTPTPLGDPVVPSERIVVEEDAALVARLDRLGADKVRLLGGADDALLLALHDAGLWVDTRDVCGAPSIEALRWVREQSVSETRHRHGNITGRHPGLATG